MTCSQNDSSRYHSKRLCIYRSQSPVLRQLDTACGISIRCVFHVLAVFRILNICLVTLTLISIKWYKSCESVLQHCLIASSNQYQAQYIRVSGLYRVVYVNGTFTCRIFKIYNLQIYRYSGLHILVRFVV